MTLAPPTTASDLVEEIARRLRSDRGSKKAAKKPVKSQPK